MFFCSDEHALNTDLDKVNRSFTILYNEGEIDSDLGEK